MENISETKIPHQFEVEITDYAPPGRGIGHFAAKAIFVAGACPKDRLLVEIITEKKDFIEARIVEILEASPERITPDCPHYLECGGCDLLQLPYEKQLQLKEEMLAQILKGKGLELTPKIIPSPVIWHYRYKTSLKARGAKVGLNREKSEQVISIPECKILAQSILDSIPKIEALRDLEADYPMLASTQSHHVAAARQLKKTQESLPGFSHATIEDYGFGKMELWGANFAQANPFVTKLMSEQIQAWAEGHTKAVELYAGSGTLTIPLAQIVEKVTTYESNAKAVKVALRNLHTLGLDNVKAFSHKAEKMKLEKGTSLVLADPPRAGMDKKVMGLLQTGAEVKSIIYMSCNPASQARDIQRLVKEGGFVLQEFKAYDMYCHSHHLETLALLVRE